MTNELVESPSPAPMKTTLFRGRILPWMKLLRIPAVFTAWSDVIVGALVASPMETLTPRLIMLALASSCLYLAGMVLNDFFDRKEDAVHRGFRPIPSGKVSAGAALFLGIVLLLAGNILCGILGLPSLVMSLILTGLILAYDAGGKHFWFGPLLMGSCRMGNILLGSTLLTTTMFPENQLVWAIAASLGLYIVGVTMFAKTEEKESPRAQLKRANITVIFGLLCILATIHLVPDHSRNGFLCFAVVVAIISRRNMIAMQTPTPASVQNSVKTMLMSLLMIEALIVYCIVPHGLPWAIGIVCLYIPLMILIRIISIT